MTVEQKQQFIRDLIDTVGREVLAKVHKMPEEWNGIELRQLLAEKFDQSTCPRLMIGRRKREYNNEVLVRNL